MKKYSTVEVAKLVGVSRDTLHRWIREKKVSAPPAESFGAFRVRLWTVADIERIKKYKVDRFWGKGGREKKTKRSK
jgi:DNA-binding transcriptional MerR regulator